MRIVGQAESRGVWRLALTGDLDLATVGLLHHGVEQALTADPPSHLTIDLTCLNFCDSTGIRALMDARAAVTGRAVTFQAAQPYGVTRRSMQVTGVLDVLTCVADPVRGRRSRRDARQ